MKIFITGAYGQLGTYLSGYLTSNKLFLPSQKELNLIDDNAIKKFFFKIEPNLVINLAAYTDVESAESNYDLAYTLNCKAPTLIANLCRAANIPLIHFSTDYVFDGYQCLPYKENHKTNPLNVYGKTKLLGEEGIQEISPEYYIFRTSWLYSKLKNNFYNKVINKVQSNETISIVDDQLGVPTSTIFLCRNLSNIINKLSKEKVGIYHLVPDGYCSWFDFAREIILSSIYKDNISLLKSIKSSDYKSKVNRPSYSVMDNEKFFDTFMLKSSSWTDELHLMNSYE